ncbi:MAG: recombination protein RecR [Bacteroidales bacterium]|nr:recombination protein RecR [Candidatus Hennigimonas equi]
MYKEEYPSQLLENAVDAISSLPGVGRRSALRLALHLLRQPQENVHHFTEAIDALRDNVCYCNECRMISDRDLCSICSDRSRDHRQICIVSDIQDVMSIENTSQYHGVYHVLGGIISPINGIGPSDLTIKALLERLDRAKAASGTDSLPDVEIIMALPGDVEGETTAFYLYRQLVPYGVKVTAIARGLGFGDGLQYADAITLGRSIAGRQPFKAQ